jgi:hypothetical protein
LAQAKGGLKIESKNMNLHDSAAVSNAPTFLDSPAIAWFGHLMPDDGIVDAVDVKINWNSTYLGDDNDDWVLIEPRIKDVAVLFNPRKLIGRDHPLRTLTCNLDEKFFYYTHGNTWSDWADFDIETEIQNIWDDFIRLGFLNDAEAERARLEFARIRECTWARDPAYEKPKGSPWTDKDYAELEVKRAKTRTAASKRKPDTFDPEDNSLKAWIKRDIPKRPIEPSQ